MIRRMRMSVAVWWKTIFVLFAVLVTFNALGDMFGKLEGRLFPVKGEAQLMNIRERPGPSIEFDGTAVKYRDCVLDHIEWMYRNDSGDLQRVDLVRRGRPEFTQPGRFYFYNWELYITPTDLLTKTRAYAFHICHPLYKTITLFFNGEGDGK